MRALHLLTASVTAATLIAVVAPAASSTTERHGGACSPDAALLGFSDDLDKTTFEGTQVSGLSALARVGRESAIALVDNIGTTPARFYHLRYHTRGDLDVEVDDVTTLTRPDGTAYTGADFDGEGMVVERGGKTILASSETEPSIRRFQRSDGRQVGELSVPSRFHVAPAGDAAENATFESLSVAPDGRTLYAGMEGPLASDGVDTSGRGLNRILRYEGLPGGTYEVAEQLAYRTDQGLGLVELVALGGDQVLALERGYTPDVGNTIRLYQVDTADASDVTGVPSLQSASDPHTFVVKDLLVDLVTCPPSGATAKQPQPNPLLDNVEAMALGRRLGGDRYELLLLSDDNANPTQITRFYRLAVSIS